LHALVVTVQVEHDRAATGQFQQPALESPLGKNRRRGRVEPPDAGRIGNREVAVEIGAGSGRKPAHVVTIEMLRGADRVGMWHQCQRTQQPPLGLGPFEHRDQVVHRRNARPFVGMQGRLDVDAGGGRIRACKPVDNQLIGNAGGFAWNGLDFGLHGVSHGNQTAFQADDYTRNARMSLRISPIALRIVAAVSMIAVSLGLPVLPHVAAC
jgi:hypothetical protein